MRASVFNDNPGHVGIELMKGEVADAVLSALKSARDDVSVSELPGYIVIEVPHRLDLTVEEVRDQLGRPDWVMTDLNEVMPAFAGTVETFTEDRLVLARPAK